MRGASERGSHGLGGSGRGDDAPGQGRRSGAWALARRTCGVLAVVFTLLVAGHARAEEAQPAEWERLSGPTGPVTRLFAPASGALLAQSGGDLHRSDDGGDTWRPVALPPHDGASARIVHVNPADHTTIYASGAEGLYRTVDDATSWSSIRARDMAFPNVLAVAASPVDRGLLYLAASSTDGKVVRFERSRDAGVTWEHLEQDGHSFLSCRWSVALLQFHPTDANRLYRAASCPRSGGPLASLQESADQGGTWVVLAELGGVPPETVRDPRTTRGAPTPAATSTPVGRVEVTTTPGQLTGNPERLVGSAGSNPARFHLAVNKDPRGGGSSLLRSEDDGRVWREVLGFDGGGSATSASDSRPDIRIGGLTSAPSEPDWVYVALNQRTKGQPATPTVLVTADAGETWTELAPAAGLGTILDLALGIDGANLYAATEQGVWRLRLR